MKCQATVNMDGFETVCGAPDTVKVCPFSNAAGCIAEPRPLGTALHDAEEGEIVAVRLDRLGGPVVSEFLDSLTPEERKGAMKLLRKIQEVMFGE